MNGLLIVTKLYKSPILDLAVLVLVCLFCCKIGSEMKCLHGLDFTLR